ncbi:MAG: hypothetical protein OEZ11_15655 [Gammaproteobacteria bacterium]|nr:hypothetical protein [Gammaproteobacteria bacterium]
MVELENRLLCPLDDEVLFQDGEFEGDAFEAEAEQFVPFVVPVRAKRAVKMEIQVLHNRVFRVSRSGKRRLLGRKFGPPSTQFLHKGKKGRPAGKGKEGTAIELQS